MINGRSIGRMPLAYFSKASSCDVARKYDIDEGHDRRQCVLIPQKKSKAPHKILYDKTIL